MIAIVGAGLAGLTCAGILDEAGVEYLIFDKAESVGGRVATDHVSGFLIDRGFQVILDSYPALRRHVSVSDLRPCYFDSGAMLWDRGRFWEIRNPLQHPWHGLETAFSDAFPFADKARMMLLAARVCATPDRVLLGECRRPEDRTTIDFLRAAGISPTAIERFFRPFFGGIFLDGELGTSAALFRYYLKKFSLGRAFLPLEGMVGLPLLLAARLTGHRLRLGEEVSSIQVRSHRAESLKLADSNEIPVEAVVIASDAGSAGKLLGVNARQPLFRRVWQLAWTSPEPLTSARMLILPAGRRVLRHLTQITNVAPGYSPSGRPLLVASVLEGGTDGDAALAAAARREVCEIFPTCGDKLELVDIRRVDRAVIHQPPGFLAKKKTFDHPANIILAGDYLSTSSIESAMASGERAARRVLRCVESLTP